MKTQVNVAPKMISNLLDDVFGNNSFMSRELKHLTKTPAVNINKSKEGYALSIWVPGIDKNLIGIEVKNNVLRIGYEHKEDIAEEGVEVIKSEYTVGSFERSFSLDSKMDVENISAKYNNGVLDIFIPIKKEEQPKEVKISIG